MFWQIRNRNGWSLDQYFFPRTNQWEVVVFVFGDK